MKTSKKMIIAAVIIIVFTGLSTWTNIEQNAVRDDGCSSIGLEISGDWTVGWGVIIDNTDPSEDWDYYKSTYPWCSGMGTPGNPYVIENVTFQTSLSIWDSDPYFQIKNCFFTSTNGYLDLINVTNGEIINNFLVHDITLSESRDNLFEGNTMKNPNWRILGGIRVSSSSNNIIRNNIINTTGIGIKTYGESEFNTIEGNTLEDSEYAMSISGANETIFNNTIEDCIFSGILIEGDDSLIVDNTINNCSEYGVDVNSNNNTIDGNSIDNCLSGIYISYNENNELIDNIINCEQVGIELSNAPNTTISGNQMTGCGLKLWRYGQFKTSIIDDGTNFVNGRHLYYYENQVGLGMGDFTDAGQIIMKNCNGSLIANENVSSATVGILLNDCHNLGISNNIANNNCWAGIYTLLCSEMLIINNEAKNCWHGMWIDESHNEIESNDVSSNSRIGIACWGDFNEVKDNIINNNNKGLLLDGPNNTVSSNTINYNKDIAIDLMGQNNTIEFNQLECNRTSSGISLGLSTHYNLINNNTILNADSYGIEIYRSNKNTIKNNYIQGVYTPIRIEGLIDIYGTNNLIYSNIIVSPTHMYAPFDSGINNKWDHEGIGNYWSNYEGSDVDDDGIGDTPYAMSGSAGSYDNFPIWWDPPEFTVDSLTENQKIGSEPPELNVTITGGQWLVKWYSLDNGTTIHFFTSNDTIDQDAWDAAPEGTVTILVSMMDSRGYSTVIEINVIKQIDRPQPAIPFELIVTISVISGAALIGVAVFVLMRRRRKSL